MWYLIYISQYCLLKAEISCEMIMEKKQLLKASSAVSGRSVLSVQQQS